MNLWAVFPAGLLIAAGIVPPAGAQFAGYGPWEQSNISLGLNSYTGDRDSISFHARLHVTVQKGRLELDTTNNVNLNKSDGASIAHSEASTSVLRLLTHAQSRLYSLLHLSLEHHESGGLDFRGAAAPGIGVHAVNNDRIRLSLEGGISYTVERQVHDTTYWGLFFDPTLRWKITKETTLKQTGHLVLNGEESRDVRLNSESDLHVQIGPRVGLYGSLIVNFDNHPVADRKKTGIQTSVNLQISLRKSRP